MLFLTPDYHESGEPASTGEHQLYEAKGRLDRNESYENRMQLVRDACSKQFGNSGPTYEGGSEGYVYPENIFDDAVVFKKGNRLYRVGYSINNGEVEFADDLAEVAPTYSTVRT